MKYDQLREKGLANFESLLELWGLEYKKLTEVEYDFISPTRSDRNFGACRFNVDKGRGADFATVAFTNEDLSILGNGFDKNDINGFSNGRQYKAGFDIIGLVQRVHSANTYSDAAGWLKTDLDKIAATGTIITPGKDAAERRRKEQEVKQEKIIAISQKIWHISKNIKGTLGERYLNSRNIYINEPNVRYHPGLINMETKSRLPAVLFKVQIHTDGPIVAIHRIFIKRDGSGKAKVEEPKKALGRIKGAGIWFGTPDKLLYVSEGPENALSLREVGIPFVVCSVYAGNFHTLKIPDKVKTVILRPDKDNAGMTACKKAVEEYTKQGKQVKVSIPNG